MVYRLLLWKQPPWDPLLVSSPAVFHSTTSSGAEAVFPALSQSLSVNAIEILSQVECLMFRDHLGIHLNMTQALFHSVFFQAEVPIQGHYTFYSFCAQSQPVFFIHLLNQGQQWPFFSEPLDLCSLFNIKSIYRFLNSCSWCFTEPTREKSEWNFLCSWDAAYYAALLSFAFSLWVSPNHSMIISLLLVLSLNVPSMRLANKVLPS